LVILSNIELNLFLMGFTWAQFTNIQILNLIFERKGANMGLRGVSDACNLWCKLLNKWVLDWLILNLWGSLLLLTCEQFGNVFLLFDDLFCCLKWGLLILFCLLIFGNFW
jgi:hypothetical protein